jgi:hypothetical protein
MGVAKGKKAKLSNQISGIDISLPRASFIDQICQGDPWTRDTTRLHTPFQSRTGLVSKNLIHQENDIQRACMILIKSTIWSVSQHTFWLIIQCYLLLYNQSHNFLRDWLYNVVYYCHTNPYLIIMGNYFFLLHSYTPFLWGKFRNWLFLFCALLVLSYMNNP